MYIGHRWPDGRYEATFRYYQGCILIDEQRQFGTWKMVDATTIRTVVTSINGVDTGPWNIDYRILELTAERYRYVNVETGIEYTGRRVDANFTFPNCGLTS